MNEKTVWSRAAIGMLAGGMLVAGLLALAACQGAGQRKADLSPVGEARMDQYHKSCLASGGEYLPTAKQSYTCTGVPKDAGKACSKASDCAGDCLARSRSCAPVVPLFGCNEVLDESGAQVTECLN